VHGISSVTSLPFAPPAEERLVWKIEHFFEKSFVSVLREGFCHVCKEWHSLVKSKRSIIHPFSKKLLGDTNAVIYQSDLPAKVVIEFDELGHPIGPQQFKTSLVEHVGLIQEIRKEKALPLVWFKHAFKCHPTLHSTGLDH
jgi:hypothetical protein